MEFDSCQIKRSDSRNRTNIDDPDVEQNKQNPGSKDKENKK